MSELNSPIRELLKDFMEVGVRAVLFLESFHVEGRIVHVGERTVVLRRNGEPVEFESNSTGTLLENSDQATILIDAIQAVGLDQGP